MPHDRSALIDQLRAHLTQQRYRFSRHSQLLPERRAFSSVLGAAEDCRGYGKAGPRIQLPSLRPPAVPPASRSPTRAAMGIDSSSRNPRTTAACAETVAA